MKNISILLAILILTSMSPRLSLADATCTEPNTFTKYDGVLKAVTYCAKNPGVFMDRYVRSAKGVPMSSCTAGEQGKQVYDNGVSKTMKFCDGTNWHSMKGPAKSACTAGDNGKQRFDITSFRMQFCDGSNWHEIYFADCDNDTPVLGSYCIGGGIFAGVFDGQKIIVMPSGCDGSTSNPICKNDGDTASISSAFRGSSVSDTDIVGIDNIATASTNSVQRGTATTDFLFASASMGAGSAAHYCSEMQYGGNSDWYLPTKTELTYLFCKSNQVFSRGGGYPQEDPTCGGIFGGAQDTLDFAAQSYSSSSEVSTTNFWSLNFATGSMSSAAKNSSQYRRCIRRAAAPAQIATIPVGGLHFCSTPGSIQFVVRNTGTASTSAISVILSGVDAGLFSITANNCTSLSGDATCTFNVEFPPLVAAPNKFATVTISAATGGSSVIPLEGHHPAGACSL